MAMRLKVQDAKTADVQEEIIYYDDLEALRTTIEGALKFLRTGKLDEPEQETTLPGADIGI